MEGGARESGTSDQAPAVPSRYEEGGPPSPVTKLRDQKEPEKDNPLSHICSLPGRILIPYGFVHVLLFGPVSAPVE